VHINYKKSALPDRSRYLVLLIHHEETKKETTDSINSYNKATFVKISHR